MGLIKLIIGNFTGFRKASVGLLRPVFKRLKVRFCLDSRPRLHKRRHFMGAGFKILGLFYVSKMMKNSFLVIWYVLALSFHTSCTSPSDRDDFNTQEGRTIHDIRKFLLSVSVELQMESEKVKSNEESGVTPPPIAGASDSKGKLTQVDWIQAHLTEKHLKKLGALRIKTVSEGEPIKNSTSQVGTLVDAYSQVPFNTRYYKLDYNFLDINLPPQTSLDSIKEDPEKLWAFLLGRDIENFYGFPDTVYYILPHVESNYLILYRLGLPDTIPYDQLPLSRRVGDFLATPLVGYPVKYCLAEKEKNIYGEITDQSTPNCEGVPLGSAKYVQFETDKEHKELFKYEEKLDLFPADFFSGEWFYLRTEIQSEKRIEGNDDISNPSFQAAYLVEFQKQSNHLVAVDSSQYGLDEKDREPALSIPVKWKEYEMNRDVDSFNSFGEREKKPAGKDVERPYFLLSFQQLKKNFEKSGLSGATVKDVLVTENFVSFNIETNPKGGTSSVVRHSFLRAVDNPNYPQKQWYEQDSSTFHPISYIKQKYYNTPLHHTKADREQFYRITRFDPNKEEIRWYFSTQTPQDDWVRDFGRQAIAYEDRVFQEAGKHSPRKIRVVLDEEGGDKKLGDPRYNIINLVVTENPKPAVFGVGSHVAHPVTGEIVSATANVWVSYIVDKHYVPLVRQYIRFHIWPLPWKILPSSPGVADFLHGKIHKLCPEVTRFIADKQGVVPPFHPVKSRNVLDDGDIQKQCARKLARTHILHEVTQAIRHGHGFRHVFSASADTEHHYKNYDEIEDLFGDVEEIHNSPFPSWEDNLITDQKDWKGHLIKDQKTPPYYSSLMDHITIDFPILSVPGKYDIAATRYLYFDQLETIDNEGVVNGFVTLDSGDKSIQQEIAKGPVFFTDLDLNQSRKQIDENQLKKYYVCGGKNWRGLLPVYYERLSHSTQEKQRLNALRESDEHKEDTFCTPWDYGRTPKELVENKILSIKNDMMLYSRKYDSDTFSLIGFPISHPKHLSKLVIQWSKLRNQTLRAAGTGIYNFSSFIDSDIEEYRRIIGEAIAKEKARHRLQMTEAEKAECVRNSPSAAGAELAECAYSDLEAYSEIVPLLADFYQELLFIPPKQCVYQKISDSGISYQTVALEVVKAKVKDIYPKGSTEALFSCQSEAFKTWIKDERKDLEPFRFIAEVGGFSQLTDEVRYLIQPPADDPGDEFAMNGIYNKLKSTIDFMLLEPGVRKVFLQGVRDFLVKGYDLNPYLDGASLRKNMGLSPDEDLPRLPRFHSYEITELISDAKVNLFHIIGSLEEEKNLIKRATPFDKIQWLLKIHHDVVAENDPSDFKIRLSQLSEGNDDPSVLQFQLALLIDGADDPSVLQSRLVQLIDEIDDSSVLKSRLVQLINETDDSSVLKSRLAQFIEDNPDPATKRMSLVYGEQWPFIYQAYKRYMEDYNTPEKRQNKSFPQFFMNDIPSVLSLFSMSGEVLYAPFHEKSFWADLFAKYNEYKTCLKEAACEENKEEKEAYIKLIDSLLYNAEAG